MTSADQEYNALIITCGSLTKDFPIVQQCLPQSGGKGTSKVMVEVDGNCRVKFHIKSCTNDLSDLKENCDSTDAYIIFYDAARPEAVAIYDSFIRAIIMTKGKTVRVVGIQPLSHKRSIKQKLMKSRTISAGWGSYHQVVVNTRDSQLEKRDLYRSIGAELTGSCNSLAGSDHNDMSQCTIL